MTAGPPNIVLIMADQLAPQFTGAYGHPLVKTPNIDALAQAGRMAEQRVVEKHRVLLGVAFQLAVALSELVQFCFSHE